MSRGKCVFNQFSNELNGVGWDACNKGKQICCTAEGF